MLVFVCSDMANHQIIIIHLILPMLHASVHIFHTCTTYREFLRVLVT